MVKRLKTLTTFMLLSFGISASALALDTISGIPPGFEKLNQPRKVFVNLNYGGKSIGSYAAHFTPSSLQFDEPEKITANIPALSDQNKIAAELAVAMPTNASLICRKGQEKCDSLSPKTAAVIFDESNLSAELFINKKYLSVTSESNDRFLPLPKRELSSIYNFSGAVNGAEGQSPSYSLSNNAIISYGESKFMAQSTLADQGLRFDSAILSHEREGWDTSAGFFRSRSMQLISDSDIMGVSYASSQRTVLDEYKTEGNDIIVYLPRRSYVSIYREGRLYSSRAYEAGNQQISTEELPDGAYNITLKIQESGGATREEQRFFAKNPALPPPDMPIYYFQAGLVRKPPTQDSALPELTNKPIVRIGTTHRIDHNIGLSMGLLAINDRSIAESNIFWLDGGTQMQATFLASTSGDIGTQASIQQYTNGFSLSLDARKLWSAKRLDTKYNATLSDFTQVTNTLSYAMLDNLTVGARSSYSKSESAEEILSYGPFAQWNIWQEGESTLGFSIDASHSKGRTEGNALLNFSHRFGDYGISGIAGNSFSDSKNSGIASVRAWKDYVTPDENLIMGLGASRDKAARTINADANWQNRYGQIQGSIQQAFGNEGSGISYGGNFSFNAAQVNDEVLLGGNHNEKSAVIVETDGDANAVMQISINGNPRSTVKVGDRQVVYLAPFSTYNITLQPEKAALLDFETAPRKVTLYPGNVTRLKWSVNNFYVVTMRITHNGENLANALLHESRYNITTDNNGRIQAEVSKTEKLTFTLPDESSCQVTLPKNIEPVNGVIIIKESLECR